MKNEKNYMGFLIHNIWQILKRFSGALIWVQTSYFWRVYTEILTWKVDFHIVLFVKKDRKSTFIANISV